MSKVVNLRRVRKQRARDDARTVAEENAVRHGEPSAIRRVREAETTRADHRHEEHRRDSDEP